MGMPSESHRFRIRYMQMLCPRCDDVRVLGQPCLTCGRPPDPREVDPDRQRVRQVAEDGLGALRSRPNVSQSPPEPIEVWDLLRDLTTTAMQAMADAFGDPTKAQPLVEAAQALAQVRVDIAGAPRLRPWFALWDAASEVVGGASDAVEAFLETQLQPLPIDAQRLARRAQEMLDEAADPAAPASAALARAARIAEATTVGEAIVEMGVQLFDDATGTSLTELDREFDRYADQIAGGSPREWPPGVGTGVAQLRHDVVGRGNEERFWRVARQTFQMLTGYGSLLALLSSPEWTADLNHLLLRTHDAAVGAKGMLASANHARQEVDALLTATHAMVEGPGKYLIALLLACVTADPYADLRLLDASELIRTCGRAGGQDLLEGLEPTLRIAEAHDEFRVVGDRVQFTARTAGFSELSVPELVDKVLAAEESITGILAGTYVASHHVGAPSPNIRIEEFGLEAIPVVEAYMALGGYPVTAAALEDNQLRIETSAAVSARSLSQVSALLPFLPGDCEELVLRDSAGTELCGPISLLRDASAAEDDLAKTLAQWKAFQGWSIGGNPLLSRDLVRKLVAVMALELITSESALKTQVGNLRTLRDWARDDDLLANALSAGITLLREKAIDDVRPETVERVSKLTDFAAQQLASPF
jgi:hypothetical protein